VAAVAFRASSRAGRPRPAHPLAERAAKRRRYGRVLPATLIHFDLLGFTFTNPRREQPSTRNEEPGTTALSPTSCPFPNYLSQHRASSPNINPKQHPAIPIAECLKYQRTLQLSEIARLQVSCDLLSRSYQTTPPKVNPIPPRIRLLNTARAARRTG
jgi:hypothetical protein